MPTQTQQSNEVTNFDPIGNSGSGGNWAPLPDKTRFRMYVKTCKLTDPPPQPGQKHYLRVSYAYEIVPEDAEKVLAKLQPRLEDGQEQSIMAYTSANYTMGTPEKPSRLRQAAHNTGGFLVKADLEKWLAAGGRFDPRWVVGFRCRGVIEHTPKTTGDGVWVNVTPQPVDEFEKGNRDLFRAELAKSDAKLFQQLFAGGDEAGGDDEDLAF